VVEREPLRGFPFALLERSEDEATCGQTYPCSLTHRRASDRQRSEQTMKVTLGYREFRSDGMHEGVYGTLEQTADGLHLLGDVETLQIIL
jgi:hypothetical protein